MKSCSIRSKVLIRQWSVGHTHTNDLMTKTINTSDKIGKIYPTVAVAKKTHLTRSTEVHRFTKLSKIELDYKLWCLFWFWFLHTDANFSPLVATHKKTHIQPKRQSKTFIIFIRTTTRIKSNNSQSATA